MNAIDEEKTHFLGAVDSDVPPWYADVNIGKNAVRFKIDSGADVSVLSLKEYNRLNCTSSYTSTYKCIAS